MRILLFANYPAAAFITELGLKETCDKRLTTWNINLIQGLASYTDLELHLVTTTKCFTDIRTVRRENVSITYIGLPPKINTLSLYRYPIWKSGEIIRKYSPDILHGIGTEHIWAYACLQFRAPGIVTVHGILNELNKIIGYPFLSRNRYLAHVEMKVFRKARHLVAINPYVVDLLKDYGYKGRIYPIENPVSELYIKNQSSPDESNQILFIGDVEPNKNVGMLIRACELIDNRKISIKIIGKVKDRQYHKRILPDTIRHSCEISHSHLTQAELMEEMKRSAFLVLCSHQETAPMVVSEAQAMGLPVVATRVGGIHYMVRDQINGFTVDPGNIDQLRDRIELLLDDPGLRNRMGKEAKQEAILRHDPKIVAEKTAAAYQEVYMHEKL